MKICWRCECDQGCVREYERSCVRLWITRQKLALPLSSSTLVYGVIEQYTVFLSAPRLLTEVSREMQWKYAGGASMIKEVWGDTKGAVLGHESPVESSHCQPDRTASFRQHPRLRCNCTLYCLYFSSQIVGWDASRDAQRLRIHTSLQVRHLPLRFDGYKSS